MEFIDFPQEVHPERMFVVNNLGNYAGKVVLDIGCGEHKSLPDLTGIDIRPVTDIQSSAEELKFDNNSVDVIVSRHSFEHFLNPVVVMKEWLRVLKPCGKIIFVLPDHSKIDTMIPEIGGGVHLHAYSPDSFRDFLNMFDQVSGDITSPVSPLMQIVIENWSFGCIIYKISL